MFFKNYCFLGRYGFEWGSGGIFGLRYYNGVFYFIVVFEVEVYFIDVKSGEEKIYDFILVGDVFMSGGDIYNVVEIVDEFIYFGGWVYVLVVYCEDRRIFFNNKYFYVYVYDIVEGLVKFFWKEFIYYEIDWVGEISDIIYDFYGDRFFLVREDGYVNFGVYFFDRKRGKVEFFIIELFLKGMCVYDVVFFGVGNNFIGGVREFRVFDFISGKWEVFKLGGSVDGKFYERFEFGVMVLVYNRVFVFVCGGIFVGNFYMGEVFIFYCFFDFLMFYVFFCVNVINVGGGIFMVFNFYYDVLYRKDLSDVGIGWDFMNIFVGLSVFVYIVLLMVKIVGVFGVRVMSIEKMDGKFFVVINIILNIGVIEVMFFDIGNRDIVVLDEKIF